MRARHRLLVLLTLGAAACTAKPPEPAPAPQTVVLRPTHSVRPEGPPPLYVVDGDTVSEAAAFNIRAEEISSIYSVRGQAAVDRYGSRGANGVIVITTKRGGG